MRMCLAQGIAVALLASLTHLPYASAKRVTVIPFSKVAEEFRDALDEAHELEWRAGNSTEEKASVQWFLSTALQEMATIKKVDFNASINGTLAYKYEACAKLTGAPMPSWEEGLTLPEAIKQDDKVAPGLVEVHMHDLYETQEREEELTLELGQCAAECPPTFLSVSRLLARAPAPGPAPAPAPGAAAPVTPPPPPTPRELMRSVADAIYNTSASMQQAQGQLKKDKASKKILADLSAAVMAKLLKVRKDMMQMHKDLDVCLREPLATHLEGHVIEAMADDKDAALEVVHTAEAQTKSAKAMVATLEKKLADCKRRCALQR